MASKLLGFNLSRTQTEVFVFDSRRLGVPSLKSDNWLQLFSCSVPLLVPEAGLYSLKNRSIRGRDCCVGPPGPTGFSIDNDREAGTYRYLISSLLTGGLGCRDGEKNCCRKSGAESKTFQV